MKKLLLLLSVVMLASCTGGDPNTTYPNTNAPQTKQAAVKYKKPKELAVSESYEGAEKYVFDKDHTTILFFINHLGFSDKIGRFDDYDGYFVIDRKHPERSMVEVTIRPKGINTGSRALDREVQKKEWFNTAKYPTVHFESTEVELTSPTTAKVTGWLTMLGQEKPVTMNVMFTRSGTHPVNHEKVAGFKASFTVKRTEFGMNNFVPMVGEYVRFQVEAEGFKQN